MSGVRHMADDTTHGPEPVRHPVALRGPRPAAAAARGLQRGLEGVGALLGNAYGVVARHLLTRKEGLEDRLAERQALRQRSRAQLRPSSPSQTDS